MSEHPAVVVDVVCVAGISVVEHLEGRHVDPGNRHTVEKDICHADHICESRVRTIVVMVVMTGRRGWRHRTRRGSGTIADSWPAVVLVVVVVLFMSVVFPVVFIVLALVPFVSLVARSVVVAFFGLVAGAAVVVGLDSADSESEGEGENE